MAIEWIDRAAAMLNEELHKSGGGGGPLEVTTRIQLSAALGQSVDGPRGTSQVLKQLELKVAPAWRARAPAT